MAERAHQGVAGSRPASATASVLRSICFVGINNLPALAPEFSHLGFGGAELQQTLLAKALAKRGFDVSMVVADLGQPEGERWSGVRTLRAYPPDGGLPGLRFIHPRWTGLVNAVHRSGAWLRYCSCAGLAVGQTALYTRRHPGRVVFRVASNSDCIPDRLLVPNWRGKKLYEYGLRHADLVLAQNSEQQLLLQQNYARPSTLVASLVDFDPHHVPLAERNIDMLWVGNLRQVKRPDLALELASAAPDLQLQIIGGTQPGEEGYYQQMQRQAQSLANVVFQGLQPYATVNAHMARARVHVNTSDIEGFPNTFLQAWARGTPVVSFFDPGGVVAEQRLGFIVRTVAEMRDAVTRLLGDTALWQEYSERCRAYVSRRHGDAAVDAYVAALEPLCRQQDAT